jgi:hypothetical protein
LTGAGAESILAAVIGGRGRCMIDKEVYVQAI